MGIDKLEIRAQSQPYRRCVDLLVMDGKAIGQPITMKEMSDNEMAVVGAPTLSISNESAQTLIDDLWHCGLRPSEGTGSAGSLKATESHLEDMRAIVSKKLLVDLK